MSRLLFDTTFLIDAERAEEDLDSLVHDEDDVAVAVVTIAEMRVGALLATSTAENLASPSWPMSSTSSR